MVIKNERFKKLRLKEVRNVLLTVGILTLIDVCVALLGGAYLSERIGAFLGKSDLVILSDLLFLEGATIFAFGTFFLGFGIETRKTKPNSNPLPENASETLQPPKKRINTSLLIIFAGAMLMGLAVCVGILAPFLT